MDDILANIFGAAFLLLAIGGPILLIIIFGLKIIEDIFLFSFGDQYFTNLPLTRVNPKYRPVLSSKCAYYQALSAKDKIKFEKRIVYFLKRNKFHARQLPEVTLEMRVLIASSAVQLTFGLPAMYFPLFNKVLVYPDSYYSEIFKRYHKGECNPRHKMIVFSWKNFEEGYADSEDGINLGLHEMAHALELENMIHNKEYDFLDWDAHKNWIYLAREEMEKINQGIPHFFRPYAGVNRQEFFAVCIENFFERPLEFKTQLPDLYYYTSKMLNQDPLKHHKATMVPAA